MQRIWSGKVDQGPCVNTTTMRGWGARLPSSGRAGGSRARVLKATAVADISVRTIPIAPSSRSSSQLHDDASSEKRCSSSLENHYQARFSFCVTRQAFSVTSALVYRVRKPSSRTRCSPHMRRLACTSRSLHFDSLHFASPLTLLPFRRQLSRARPSSFLLVSTMGYA
jgi:hypothetical protein